MPEDIHEWVRQRLNDGEDPGALKERLSAYGHDSSIVDNVRFPAPTTSPEVKKEEVKKSKVNKFVIVGLIILIIIGMFALSFVNSISDHRKYIEILSEVEQKMYYERTNFNELNDFAEASILRCEELKNYIFFGHPKERCYAGVLMFYIVEIETLLNEDNLSQKEMDQAGNFIFREFCPNIEDKVARSSCIREYSKYDKND